MLLQQNQNGEISFEDLVVYLFKRGTSAFLVIFGRRETGKTDISLLITEILYANDVIKHFATNIRIYKSPYNIERIITLPDLEQWCQTLKGKKLFILDEAGKSIRRRTPMSRLNIQLLDKLQIMRKYKLSLIFVTPHEKYIDKATLGSDILDGIFVKPNYSNPKIALYKDALERLSEKYHGIPRTIIKYDTWDSAPFSTTRPKQKPKFKEEDLSLLWDWANGATWASLNVARKVARDKLRKFVRENLENDRYTLTNISCVEGKG